MSAETLLQEIYEACPEVDPRNPVGPLQQALLVIDKTMSNIKNTSISSSSEIVDALLDIRSQVSAALAVTQTESTGK